MRLISNMFVVVVLCIAIVDCTHVRHVFQKYEHVYHILLLLLTPHLRGFGTIAQETTTAGILVEDLSARTA